MIYLSKRVLVAVEMVLMPLLLECLGSPMEGKGHKAQEEPL